MATVVGYLRRYCRWNGMPGFAFDQQRAWIREIASVMDYGRGRVGRFFLEEEADGERWGWPALRKAIQRAEDNEGLDHLVVIPTLDGVQFNVSFLEILAECLRSEGRSERSWSVFVRSGWWRPKSVARNTNYRYRPHSLGWQLADPNEADAFAEIVERVRKRNRTLGSAISAGLQEAAARGTGIGASRHGSYRLTKANQSKGGQKTANQRRRTANEPYRRWLADIMRWRAQPSSLGQIVMKLAERGALTPDGRKIGPMLVHRIIKRQMGSRSGPIVVATVPSQPSLSTHYPPTT
jgi:hypothetical protein